MTDAEIKAAALDARARITGASHMMDRAAFDLKQIRARCPHNEKQTWTNDDGDGKFTVERCLVCGLQQDGGLKIILY